MTGRVQRTDGADHPRDESPGRGRNLTSEENSTTDSGTSCRSYLQSRPPDSKAEPMPVLSVVGVVLLTLWLVETILFLLSYKQSKSS